MATVIIKSKSKAAKQMLEYLKTQPYAEVIEEDKENEVQEGVAVYEKKKKPHPESKSITGEFNDEYDINAKPPLKKAGNIKMKVIDTSKFYPINFID
jgi:hypothetical protein